MSLKLLHKFRTVNQDKQKYFKIAITSRFHRKTMKHLTSVNAMFLLQDESNYPRHLSSRTIRKSDDVKQNVRQASLCVDLLLFVSKILKLEQQSTI